MRRWDVVWVELPPQAPAGGEQHGRRPAVVMTEEEGSATRTVVVVPLTSNLASSRLRGTVAISDAVSAGLARPSVALAFQIRAVDRDRLRGRAGTLASDDRRRLADSLKGLLGL